LASAASAIIINLLPFVPLIILHVCSLAQKQARECCPSVRKLNTELDEILKRAYQSATSQKRSHPSDQDLLAGFCKEAKIFSPPANLIHACQKTPKQLLDALAYAKPSIPSSFLEDPAAGQDITSLFIYLVNSPTLSDVWEHVGLNPNTAIAAVEIVKQKALFNTMMAGFRELIEVVVVVLIMVISIRQGLGEFRLIPSESMVPTLLIGDRIVVEKLSHWVRPVNRNDILVFYPPEPEAIVKKDPLSRIMRWSGISGLLFDKESHIDTAYIKRVIGLPGDVLEVRPQTGVFINGQKLNEPFTNEIASSCTIVPIGYCGSVKIPPHTYFMMGDNRNHSADSRYWGLLPEDRIVGRAVFRFFPFDTRFGLLH
jgi:signal peptidase I